MKTEHDGKIFGILGGIGVDADNPMLIKQAADKLFGESCCWSSFETLSLQFTALGEAPGLKNSACVNF